MQGKTLFSGKIFQRPAHFFLKVYRSPCTFDGPKVTDFRGFWRPSASFDSKLALGFWPKIGGFRPSQDQT